MKKYFTVLLVIVLLFSFSACSKSAANGTKSALENSSAVSTDTSEVNASSSEDSGTVASTVSDTPQSQSSSSSVSSTGKATASSVVSSPAKQPGSSSKAVVVSQAASQSTSESSQPATARTVRIVIPEGFTLSQIGDRLEANGVCKKADLLTTANSYDFSYYSLIGQLSANANRCYKLEGYLFPNTYEFYTNMKPQDALGRMLKNAQSKIGSNYSYSGMTTDQIVALASIIEKESGNINEMTKVSSVFHNRLKAGMRLQADVTINYVEKYLKPNLTDNKDRYNSFYNTYKCSALPVGAICNPGANALNAAANPADTNYLYFAADASGNYYYAQTLDEHKANLAKGNIVEGGGMQ